MEINGQKINYAMGNQDIEKEIGSSVKIPQIAKEYGRNCVLATMNLCLTKEGHNNHYKNLDFYLHIFYLLIICVSKCIEYLHIFN